MSLMAARYLFLFLFPPTTPKTGFDPFLNLVVDESVEEISDKERKEIGMVVS